MKKSFLACLCLLALTSIWANAVSLEKDPEPRFEVKGRLSGQEPLPEGGYSISFGKEYLLQDSSFTGLLTFSRISDAEYEVAGTLSLIDSAEVLRWNSRRTFLVLFDNSALVAKIYLPTSETEQHDLNFRKRFSLNKMFNRFEITIIGAVHPK